MDKNWCYQFVARIEQRDGFLDSRTLESGSADALPSQILWARAEILAKNLHFKKQSEDVRLILRWSLWLLLLVAAAGGVSAGLAALGTSGEPVNVIWSLAGLLLVPTLMWLLWLVSLRMQTNPWWGHLWQTLSMRWLRRFEALDAWQAWLQTNRESGALRWRLGWVSNLVWLVFLMSVLLSWVFAFSLRHYTFIWETTWLSTETFVSIALQLGKLSAWMGLSMPDSNTIAASGHVPVELPEIRRQWANWLVGSVVMIGVVPRVISVVLCWSMVRVLQRRALPDVQTPYAKTVLAKWRREHALDIHDGPPGARDAWEQSHSSLSPHSSQPQISGAQGASSAVIGLDLVALPDWAQAYSGPGLVNDRESRAQALIWLDEQAPARLLLILDGGQTPDRGTMGYAIELISRVDVLQTVLVQRVTGPDRQSLWQESLRKAGLAEPITQDEAMKWLEASA
ncbi:DUF2868 domain-containing protein [Orrella sp. 11846]|uniref:DUF2868 domain-containing protein n=1 Tax=Orrella sp. 11846 TaxID=3409913 RepID=UPI003B5BF164